MSHETSGRVALPYLAAWRRKQFKTQRGLAGASGVSANAINSLEQGKTRANYVTVGKLARGLSITMEQLVNVNPFASEQGTQTEGEQGQGHKKGAA